MIKISYNGADVLISYLKVKSIRIDEDYIVINIEKNKLIPNIMVISLNVNYNEIVKEYINKIICYLEKNIFINIPVKEIYDANLDFNLKLTLDEIKIGEIVREERDYFQKYGKLKQ